MSKPADKKIDAVTEDLNDEQLSQVVGGAYPWYFPKDNG